MTVYELEEIINEICSEEHCASKQLLIPTSKKVEILQQHHDETAGGLLRVKTILVNI